MTGGALGDSWYRVAGLRPRLRPQARIHRQRHRGDLWYVLQDSQSGRYFRVSPVANYVLCQMNGRRTMAEIWALAGRRFGAERPPQDEIVRLLSQLHRADLLQGVTAPDMGELARRADSQRRARLIGALRSPMAIRVPLFDPDRLLALLLPILRPFLGVTGLLLWTALVAIGAGLAVMHGDELAGNLADRVLAADNLLLLALTYPFVKALHELGHGIAAKAGGGEVHETGVLLLLFFPVPYVDASASSAFPDGRARALVGAAGIMVELALAALAMMVWLAVEPGMTRAAAFNVMLIGGVSTLLFNGNPLMRFDGYYVLSDLLEIPNLDSRAKRHLLQLLQRGLFGIEPAESPTLAPGEGRWLVAYGVAAFVYRTAITLGIALLIAGQFFVLGAALALWSVVQAFLLPAWRALRFLATSPRLKQRRARALAVSTGLAAVVAGAVFLIPLPYATVAEGVVWVPDDVIVRARGEGFVQRMLAEPDAAVTAGQPLIELDDPVAVAQLAVKRAELAVLEHRYTAVNLIDLVQARLVAEQLDRARAQLARAEQRAATLVVTAPRDGRLVVPDARKLVGRFVREGDLLAYVIGPNDVAIHTVVPQAEIDLVRQRTTAVAVRTTDEIGRSAPARVARQTPSALERAPAPALAPEGGGPMLVDPADPRQQRPLDRFYEIELQLDGMPVERIGGRVFARFDLGDEPVAWRALRGLRQLFLRLVHV